MSLSAEPATAADPAASDGAGQDQPAPLAAAAELGRQLGRLGSAWIDLTRSELALARASVLRLLVASVLFLVLCSVAWLSLCAGLGFGLLALSLPAGWAIVAVFAFNIFGIALLTKAMRSYWRNLGLPRTRAAVRELVRPPS